MQCKEIIFRNYHKLMQMSSDICQKKNHIIHVNPSLYFDIHVKQGSESSFKSISMALLLPAHTDSSQISLKIDFFIDTCD